MDLPFSELATAATALAAGAHATISSFRFVREGEKGVMLRFGKARRRRGVVKVFEPGFTVLIPYVDKLVTRHVRVQTIDLPQQTITIKNGLSYVVDAVVRFQVQDIYKALFVVDDLDQTMKNVAMAELRDVLTPYEGAEAMADVQGMSALLTEKIRAHSSTWGVVIEQFSIVSCVPTPESQQIVNVAAGVKARVAALMSGIQTLGIGPHSIGAVPQLAAVLVGIPVATAIGAPLPHGAAAAPPAASRPAADE